MGFWHKQPPKSPFSKGDLTKSPLKKGARGLYSASIVKVAELLPLIQTGRKCKTKIAKLLLHSLIYIFHFALIYLLKMLKLFYLRILLFNFLTPFFIKFESLFNYLIKTIICRFIIFPSLNLFGHIYLFGITTKAMWIFVPLSISHIFHHGCWGISYVRRHRQCAFFPDIFQCL